MGTTHPINASLEKCAPTLGTNVGTSWKFHLTTTLAGQTVIRQVIKRNRACRVCLVDDRHRHGVDQILGAPHSEKHGYSDAQYDTVDEAYDL